MQHVLFQLMMSAACTVSVSDECSVTVKCDVLFQLAMSAASPIYRGYLADIDTRWTVIAQSVDDRTKEERGLEVC